VKAEEQYFIYSKEVWITREGNGIVEDRHLKTQQNHIYHKVVGRETRYIIRGASGNIYMPANLYENLLSQDAYL
jgi:hypothetical protein